MPESIPAPLIIDTLKDTFREARGTSTREPLGWILSVPDTHQKTVLAALDKERALRVVTCATEDEANAVAAGLWIGWQNMLRMLLIAALSAVVFVAVQGMRSGQWQLKARVPFGPFLGIGTIACWLSAVVAA